jgi:preprotein translocase subunit SecG
LRLVSLVLAALPSAAHPVAVPPAAHEVVPPHPAGGAAVPPAPVPPAPAPLPPQPTWFQAHAPWLTHGIAALFVLSALALIILLAVQTTKQEGLSGTIGGRVESAYGRLGAEEQLKRITGAVAVLFVITATILSLTGI